MIWKTKIIMPLYPYPYQYLYPCNAQDKVYFFAEFGGLKFVVDFVLQNSWVSLSIRDSEQLPGLDLNRAEWFGS